METRSFLKDLVQNLDQVLGGRDSCIGIEVTCNDLALCPDHAFAAMALFVTEAVTNAFKQALKGCNTGRINARQCCNDAKECIVIVGDNGVGMAERAGAGTGLLLVQASAQ